MPSLNQLEQLKNLFAELGGEKAILESVGHRPDNYELPENEPSPVKPPPPESSTPIPSQREPPPPEPGPAKTDAEDATDGKSSGNVDEDGGSGFDIDSLFDGLDDFAKAGGFAKSEPPEPAEYVKAEETAPPEGADDAGDIDFDDIQFDTPELEPEAEKDSEATADDGIGELDGPDGIEDFDLDTSAIDVSNEDDANTADADLEALLDADDEQTPKGEIDTPLNDDEIPSFSGVSEEELATLAPNAPPEEFAEGLEPVDALPPAPPPEESPEAAADEGLPGLDDFNIPALAGDTKDGAKPIIPAAPEAKPEEVEAFSLTDDELKELLAVIKTYPLNLRIACEKAIAEEVIEQKLLSALVKLLLNHGSARECAALVGKILKKRIELPKRYRSGEDLEAEQQTFTYIFAKKYWPVLRISIIIAALAASIVYLSYQFVYKPIAADIIYKNGYERIIAGDYDRAKTRFDEAFKIHRVKNWFYKYAEKFRDERQYIAAEEKYDELLLWYPHDKEGALDYAKMELEELRNFEKADRIVRTNILDYKTDDPDALIALGDINLEWGETNPERYESARQAYARYISIYGQTDPILERMLKYFIRTDKLVEVIPLQDRFMSNPKSVISAATLAELGGYLLDKTFDVPTGVPDENIERITGIKDVLLRAVKTDWSLPESHYHLARYYGNYNAKTDERSTLQTASGLFDTMRMETPTRIKYRIDTQRRLAEIMIAGREYLPAEEALVKGINVYEDALGRNIITRYADAGRLYADLGDLEYFVKSGDMTEAIRYYDNARQNDYSPFEMRYRLGAAHYRQGDYEKALDNFWSVLSEIPYNRRLLNAMGNVSYLRDDFFAASGYYGRLLGILENERSRFSMLLPNDRPEHKELMERTMVVQNNLGVTLNSLAARTGRADYRAQALASFAESQRLWDTLERDPETMARYGIFEQGVPGVSLPYLNIQHTLYPIPGEQGRLFMQLDKDVLEPSEWEERTSR